MRDDAAGFYIQTDEPDMPVQAVLDDMIAESESDVLQAGMINESLTSGLSEEDLSIFGEISQMSELVGEDEIPVSAGDGRGILPEDSAEPKVSGSAVETSPASAETVKKDEPENRYGLSGKRRIFRAPAVKTAEPSERFAKKREEVPIYDKILLYTLKQSALAAGQKQDDGADSRCFLLQRCC